MTLQEYFSTPETVIPQELIFGAMRVAESPTSTHQRVVGELFVALHEHVRRRSLGSVWLAPLDVILDPDEGLVVQPDLFFIRHGGAARVADKVFGAPDLVIEVLSPYPRIGEVTERVGWFRDYGVRECWLIHQIDRNVEVLTFEAGKTTSRRAFGLDDRIESGVLPEFDGMLLSIMGY